MTSHTSKKMSVDVTNIFFVRSNALKPLREFIEAHQGFNGVIGSAVSFKLVIDTNIVLGDLIWLVSTRRDPTAKTALMEVIEAATVDVYVPPRLLDEVTEKIPLIASSQGLDADLMHAEWQSYRQLLKIEHPDQEKVAALKLGQDPDDADFIALAQTIMAVGVVSKDKDIGKMGGNTISIECITCLRNYSREVAVELNIKVNGVVFTLVGQKTISSLFAAAKTLFSRIGSAPDWAKAALLTALVFVLLNPRLRARIGDLMLPVLSSAQDALPLFLEIISSLAVEANTRNAAAQRHLAGAMKELKGCNAPKGNAGNDA